MVAAISWQWRLLMTAEDGHMQRRNDALTLQGDGRTLQRLSFPNLGIG